MKTHVVSGTRQSKSSWYISKHIEMLANQEPTSNNTAHSLISKKELKVHTFHAATKKILNFPCPHVNGEIDFLKTFTLEGVFQKPPFSVTQNAFYMWTKGQKLHLPKNSNPITLSFVHRFCIFMSRYPFTGVRVNVKMTTKVNLLYLVGTLNFWINSHRKPSSVCCSGSTWTKALDKPQIVLPEARPLPPWLNHLPNLRRGGGGQLPIRVKDMLIDTWRCSKYKRRKWDASRALKIRSNQLWGTQLLSCKRWGTGWTGCCI